MMKRGAILTGGLLMLVSVAGCLGEVSDRLDPPEEDPYEPHKRLEKIHGHTFMGGSCFRADNNLPNVLGPNCVDVVPQVVETKCDPAQLWVSDSNDPSNLNGMSYSTIDEAKEAQKSVEAPKDVYLYCELELNWQFNARTLMPDSEFHVVHETQSQMIEDSCPIPVQSQCTVEMNYIANITVNHDKESEIHEAWGEMEIEWFEPLLHEAYQSSLVFESKFWLEVR